MEINLSLSFEESPDAEVRKCLYCRKIIEGKKYQGVLQIEMNMTATNVFICEKCYQNGDQSLQKM